MRGLTASVCGRCTAMPDVSALCDTTYRRAQLVAPDQAAMDHPGGSKRSLTAARLLLAEVSMGSCVNCGGPLKRRRRYDFKSAAFRKVYGDKFVYVCTHCGLYQADVSKIDEAGLLKYYRTEYRAIAKIGVGDAGHRWYRARATALAEL